MIVFYLLGALAVVLLAYFILRRKKEPITKHLPDTETLPILLEENVLYFKKLNDIEKASFVNRVIRFLLKIKITGVHTTVTDLDRTLIGASAVIPIFRFPDWEYNNIKEVLVYPDSFDKDFNLQGNNRNVLGMVGTGAMRNTMILSQQALREGFSNKTDKNNTAIHEFVHLIDKADGLIDGIPQMLLDNQCSIPWIHLMHEYIQDIREGKSDINPYGSTNNAEFFAVAAEYFFERPALLKRKHPELYNLLDNMFHKR